MNKFLTLEKNTTVIGLTSSVYECARLRVILYTSVYLSKDMYFGVVSEVVGAV